MNTIYPAFFWNHIQTWHASHAPGSFGSETVAVTLFSKMPSFEDNDLFFSASGVEYISGDPLSVPPQKLSDLLDSPFWSTPSGISNNTLFTSAHYNVTGVGSGFRVAVSGGAFPDNSAADDFYDFVTVGAAIWWKGTLSGVVNPLMVLIHFDDELNVYKTGSSIDPPFYSSIEVTPTIFMLNKVLDYRNTNGAAAPAVGEFAISTPYVGWESPRETHVTVYPQRVNMVPNPSFESDDVWGWRSNASIAPTSLVHPACIGPQPRNQYLQVSGGGPGVKVVESLPFPTAIAQDVWWSVEAAVAVKGPSDVRIGLVAWDPTTTFPSYHTGDWVSINSSAPTSAVSNFQVIDELIELPDKASFACFRMEFKGTSGVCFLDNVLVDNNAAQLGFFDGDWFDGIEGDYTWYGGVLGPHSYSLFYNDKLNIKSILFGYPEQVARSGVVSNLTTMTSAEMRTHNTSFAPSAVNVVFDADMTNREARDEWLALNPAPAYAGVLTNGVVTGYLYDPLAQLSQTVHHKGESEKWVPEGAKVVGHYDDVYLFNSTSSDSSMYVPVEDFITGTDVNYKTTVTQVE